MHDRDGDLRRARPRVARPGAADAWWVRRPHSRSAAGLAHACSRHAVRAAPGAPDAGCAARAGAQSAGALRGGGPRRAWTAYAMTSMAFQALVQARGPYSRSVAASMYRNGAMPTSASASHASAAAPHGVRASSASVTSVFSSWGARGAVGAWPGLARGRPARAHAPGLRPRCGTQGAWRADARKCKAPTRGCCSAARHASLTSGCTSPACCKRAACLKNQNKKLERKKPE